MAKQLKAKSKTTGKLYTSVKPGLSPDYYHVTTKGTGKSSYLVSKSNLIFIK